MMIHSVTASYLLSQILFMAQLLQEVFSHVLEKVLCKSWAFLLQNRFPAFCPLLTMPDHYYYFDFLNFSCGITYNEHYQKAAAEYVHVRVTPPSHYVL